MTSPELLEIVTQRMDDPTVLGRLATNLFREDSVKQQHKDNRILSLSWQELGDLWRCTIWWNKENEAKNEARIAQIDIHENATTRIDVFEPCRVTISREEGILCLTRYKLP